MLGFPISEAMAPEHRAALPARTDVVVIGGGVIGVSTALYLRRAGHRVVLLEKGRVAGEQSSRNWGWIRVQGRDVAEVPIALEARALWRALAAEVDTDIGLKQAGVLYLAQTAAEMAAYEGWLQDVAGLGLDSRLVGQGELAGLLPGARAGWQGALWTESDMRAEPFVAVPALARLAAREGVLIREGCAVRLLDIEAGRVTGVISEDGLLRAGAVVLAGGAWSSLLLRRHGVAIPQLSVLSSVARTAPLPEVFGGAAADKGLAFRRRADGGYTLAPAAHHFMMLGPDALRAAPRFARGFCADPFGRSYRPAQPRGFPDAWGTPRRWGAGAVSPFERMRILNPAPDLARLKRTAFAFAQAFPELGEVALQQAWGGMIDVLPDVVPVVDKVDALPGLTLATGMCGHGFGIGPAFGRIAAALATGAAPGHELGRFRLSRFSDGSRLVPGPEI